MLPGREMLLEQIMRASVGSIQNNLCVKQALHSILHEPKLCSAELAGPDLSIAISQK